VPRPAETAPRHLAPLEVAPWQPPRTCRTERRRARSLLLAALAAGLLCGAGAGLSGAWLAPRHLSARTPVTVAGSASTAATGPAVAGAPTPTAGATADPTCRQAVEHADTVISLLAQEVHDQRLRSSLSQYADEARRCRGGVRGAQAPHPTTAPRQPGPAGR
jgi:hypothetical protein